MKENHETNILHGLPPIVNADSRVLVLGSMPGKQSLENSRYYDYPQNRFWKIIFRLAEQEFCADYEVVVTNGRTSEKYLTKYNADVKYTYLPSTSPANASVKDTEEIWLKTLRGFLKE